MKKYLLLVVMLLSVALYAKYEVGEVCEDISWTDSNGLSTSIYEQTAEGKAVFIFWGSDG